MITPCVYYLWLSIYSHPMHILFIYQSSKFLMRKIEMMSKGSRSSEERDWCDLPIDVLVLIKSLLGPNEWKKFDHVFSRKGKQSIPNPPFPVPAELPNSQWLVYLSPGGDDDILHFYHPLMCFEERRRDMKIPELYGSIKRCSEVDPIIRYSKYGWLLMSMGLHSLFFFNPFTKETIQLPPLPKTYVCDGVSFSSPPTSSDCIVFGVHGFVSSALDFTFIRRGKSTWIMDRLEHGDPHFCPSHCNPVFYKQMFYCLGIDGDLGVLDPNNGTKSIGEEDINVNWRVLSKPVPPMKSESIYECFLMESDGELLSVFIGEKGNSVSVFSLNRRKLVWEEVYCLGNQMLFLSHTGSFAAKCTLKGMENKIYLPNFHRKDGVFYSLESGRYHKFRRSDWCSEDLCSLEEQLNCTWIEPAQVVEQLPSNEEELDWLFISSSW